MTMNAECGTRNAERKSRRAILRMVLVLYSSFIILHSSFAFAAPTQEDVFKSISSKMNESTDSGRVMALIFGGATVLILLLLISQRQKRQVAPKALNHPGKLMKEVMKETNLKSTELKRLRALADQLELSSGETLKNPLTLMLCPSLLQKAMKKK